MSTSPELTGGAGFAFEDAVAASYLVALLAERRARGLREGKPLQVSLQRGTLGRPLDDIVITAETPNGAVTLDLQVKRSFSFSAANSNTDFFEIVDRAQQTLNQPTFKEGLDRIGVATDEIKVGDQRQISTLCEWARDSASAVDFIARIATPKLASGAQRKALEALRAGLTRAMGRAPTDHEVHGFLRHFVLLRFEIMGEGAGDLVWNLDRLDSCLANTDKTTAEDIWGAIRTLARDASGRAGSFDRQSLLERLGRQGRFSAAASLAPDLKRLNDEALLAASTIEHSIDGVILSRDNLVEQVRSELDDSRLVQLVGQPGAGKSALLRTLAETGSGPKILLRADRLPQGGWPAYAQRLGLTTSTPLPLLREMAAVGEPILFIDGLDRVARTDQALIVELVELILDDPGLSCWKIIASLRDGGWQRVRRWLPAIRRAATGSVEIPNLDDDEARLIAAQRPRLKGLLFGTTGVREMARRPFFLNVLASAIDLDAGTPSSETELLAAWWAGGGYDAEGAERARRQGALVLLARATAANLGRSGRVSSLDPEAVESLKTDAILQDAEPGHTVFFSHDIFFEWAFTHVLIDAAEHWMAELVAAGEPPALGRPVELLSQLRFERDQAWKGEFDRLEQGSARTQWRRCWLVAPFSSPLFEAHVTTFTQAVSRGTDHGRLEQLLLWFQAVRTEPDNQYWIRALGDLSEADRARLAMALAVPSDYGAWRRFLAWIIGEQDRLPPRLWSNVLASVEVWQTAADRVKNDTSERLLLMVEAWLHALEDDDRLKRRQDPRSRFVDLPYDDDKLLRLELRTLLLRGAVAHPEPAQRYLRRLIERSDLAHEAFEAVLSSAAWAVRVGPAVLVDLVLATALEQLPKAHQEEQRQEDDAARAKALSYPEGSRERSLLMPFGLGGWISSWDWDHLAIERMSSHFHPPSPIKEPFHALFREDPDEALRLVKGLANHAAAAWRELHDLDFQRGRTPRALELEFPWGRQLFWGTEREYFAYRAAFAPQILAAGLMALEDWAFGQLEAGADLDDLIRRIIEGCTHNAMLGVTSALILTRPRATWTTLPFATSQRLWRWDLARCVRIEHGAPANEIGAFGRPGDLAALKRANGRPARSRWIGNMAPVFMVADDLDLREAFIQRVSAFKGDPAHEFDEEKNDDALVADQLRTAAKWAKAASSDSYAVTETPEGALVEIKPQPPADAIEEQQIEAYSQTTRWMALAMWGETKLGDARDKGALSDAEALIEARALDAPELFGGVRMLGDLEDMRRAGVVAAAVVVLAEPQYQDTDLIDWAEDVLRRALGTPLEDDELLAPESALPFHPLKYIGQGLAGLVRRGRSIHGATHALVKITPHDGVIWAVRLHLGDAAMIFNDHGAFGVAFDARPEDLARLLEGTPALVGLKVELGPNPMVAYYTGKPEVFAVDTVAGRISATHNISSGLGSAEGVAFNNQVWVRIAFPNLVRFGEVIDTSLRLLRFLAIIAGRKQSLLAMKLETLADGKPDRFDVHWPLRPQRRSLDEARALHPRELPLNAARDPIGSGAVLARWLELDNARVAARAQFASCFDQGQSYDFIRLVGAVNMFDLLPADAVAAATPITPELARARDQARATFRALTDGPERSSVLSVLGRIGKPVLKRKIRSRAAIITQVLAKPFAHLEDVIDIAVEARNLFVHGGETELDFSGPLGKSIPFLTGLMEFLFAASDLIDCGWDAAAWETANLSWDHPLSHVVLGYDAYLHALESALPPTRKLGLSPSRP